MVSPKWLTHNILIICKVCVVSWGQGNGELFFLGVWDGDTLNSFKQGGERSDCV